ncbi:KpsF/GutQ family sugar-phosphate isomerase [Comamonas aquatica]|uniref:KpsF/GutQ family sugar-phosphate isomerase n=1 Tax=Comamonas aquatica TaxID=225991 RepID=UPI00244C3EB3|nr:KpsF/GutQ family sugar-phosphate isomerase [Comamonas aquatica]MDH0371042.1 KpsF/GutQ family sugar-phosphate isomerase [Comamonas aquatica]MDH0381617.1 KpsF/GutQ family sugar-phosphate isomerase [Comamonas aquatica]MDH0429762.1 KpsF/GutQ family sugar-phosphate isomerase [Comamonas aquatica]MDH0898191.1 KpsF/GutQ family sugar-phosphate isomerase [Comamonas aquatica]MDH0940428.1 KpsF/GutQ family sugar-phosphate isomerase [Comamonas aquatica]
MNIPMPTSPVLGASQALATARETLTIEIQSLQALAQRLDDRFVQVAQAMLATPGRVVVMGMGKSGHIGRKIAATLASTGTPAFFVHPAEASHGDLGMVTDKDMVLAISNSGESHELTSLLPALKRQGVRIAGMTGGLTSSLAKHADWVLDTSVEREACPLNLAPTASTTVQLALGDALAAALLEARGFKAEDFALSHPGGALGRKLLTHVRDVMRSGDDVPQVLAQDGFDRLMREISAKNMGASAVVDAAGRVLGIFTDGDLRRRIEDGTDLRAAKASDLMHPQPRTIGPDALAADAAQLMERHGITSVLVTDAAGTLVGMVHIRDLMVAKVI